MISDAPYMELKVLSSIFPASKSESFSYELGLLRSFAAICEVSSSGEDVDIFFNFLIAFLFPLRARSMISFLIAPVFIDL